MEQATTTREVNFDGLVGPTHNYAGLSLGNRASYRNAGLAANPRAAALQGIDKMRLLLRLGLTQAVLPPQQRPDPATLRRLGFHPATGLAEVARHFPQLVPTLMSASPMWAANAATVSPSVDTNDNRVHLTPANLSSNAHRSIEATQTTRTFRAIFADPGHFVVHDPLPPAPPFADEGAANHGRCAPRHDMPATHVFVYGRDGTIAPEPSRYPRRQTLLASRLIAHSHGLDPASTLYLQQSPTAIDAGAFHNDVVAVINESTVFHHQDAFAHPDQLTSGLAEATFVCVPRTEVPLEDAIASYLFNSQLVTLPDGTQALIAPIEVDETPTTANYLTRALDDPDNPIDALHTIDLRQSMRNGGGPACLRLRVTLTDAEESALNGSVVADEQLLDELEAWINRHYRDELEPDDLADPHLAEEANQALDELTQLLHLGNLYPFQD